MLQNELKEIRTRLRLAMNGVISTSMREKGIVYKLNFGVPLPEIKQIATMHKPDSELAAALWKEDSRIQDTGFSLAAGGRVLFPEGGTMGEGNSLFGNSGTVQPQFVLQVAGCGGFAAWADS